MIEDRAPDWRRATLIGLILVLATLAVYWPVGTYEFADFDEQLYVTENPIVQQGITARGLWWALTTTSAGNWHPLTWLSHMLDCQLFGLNAGAHHWTNVVFHAFNTVLLFLVLTRLTGACERSGFVAALFALHPLHVESVAWVAERKDVLSAFFWILAMGAYAGYARKGGVLRYLTVLSLFMLGLMSKAMVVTLPCVLLLLDFWPLKRWTWPRAAQSEPGPTTSVASNLPRLLLEKVPFFALALLSGILTCLAQQRGGAIGSFEQFPVSVRLANALVSYVRYLANTICPEGLAVLYPHPGMPEMWMVLGAIILLGCVSVAVLILTPRCPYLMVGWLWYLGTLLPVIGLVQVGAQSMADRYTYLPLIGVFIMATWGIGDMLSRQAVPRTAIAVASAVVLLCLGFGSAAQVRYWENSITVFTHAIEVTTNNATAHYNLGQAMSIKGNVAEALPHYTEALRIRPDYDRAHNNLGLSLALLGRLEEATNHYAKALSISPQSTETHFNYGLALASLEDFAGAASQFETLLKLSPDYPQAHMQLASVLSAQHKSREALDHYRAALRVTPDNPTLLNKLAWLLATDPDAGIRNGPEALRLAERACQLTAFKLPLLVGTLAAAHAEAGNFEKAVEVAEQACELAKAAGQPDLLASNQNLLAVYRSGKPHREQR
jgi:tetratricopeptide (TPR) repeat protein